MPKRRERTQRKSLPQSSERKRETRVQRISQNAKTHSPSAPQQQETYPRTTRTRATSDTMKVKPAPGETVTTKKSPTTAWLKKKRNLPVVGLVARPELVDRVHSRGSQWGPTVAVHPDPSVFRACCGPVDTAQTAPCACSRYLGLCLPSARRLNNTLHLKQTLGIFFLKKKGHWSCGGSSQGAASRRLLNGCGRQLQ